MDTVQDKITQIHKDREIATLNFERMHPSHGDKLLVIKKLEGLLEIMADIFIAYNQQDQELIDNLVETLENREGYSTFHYKRDRKFFQDPLRTSRLEIDACELFLVFISGRIKDTKFLDFEIKYAMHENKKMAVFLIDINPDQMKNSRKEDCHDWEAIFRTKTTIQELKRSNVVNYNFSDIVDQIKIKVPKIEPFEIPPIKKSKQSIKNRVKYIIRYFGTIEDRFRYILVIACFLILFLFFVGILTS